MVWGSENWAHNIYRLNPETEEFTRVQWKVQEPINAPMGGNYALDPKGFIWKTRNNEVSKVDGLTGEQTASFKTQKFPSTYGSALSRDGRYFGGGAWPRDGVVVFDSQTNELYEPSTSPGSGPARGAFDFDGNYWAGGRGGQLVKFDIKTKRVHEYKSPTPYASFYSAIADKNGEVWAGEMHGGRYSRFNPKTGVWTQYMLPEPYGIDRKSWVDNSTTPVSVWYVDQEGYIARIQPLE
jgi:streptogramin lyase